MNQKLKFFGLAFLIVAFSFFALSALASDASAKEVYVSPDQPEAWYNATQVKTIAEGITNATAGDTVHVWAGNYTESITINKILTIIGNGTENTIITSVNSSTKTITVTQNFVNISLFNISGGYNGIYTTTNNCTFKNNLIYNTSNTAIILSEASYNKILNNTIVITAKSGITVSTNCAYNIIDNNTIYTTTEYGVNLYSANNNTVSNNTIYDTTLDGIVLTSSHYNNIYNNTIYNTKTYGIKLIKANNTNIENNLIYNTSSASIYIEYWTHDTQIKNNTISNHLYNKSAIRLFPTISSAFNNVTIIYNNISDVCGDAIYLGDSIDTIISNNTISTVRASESTYGFGISLINARDALISNNTVQNAEWCGIILTNISNVLVYNNYLDNHLNVFVTLPDNVSFNVSKTAGTNIVGGSYLGGNYWGGDADKYVGTDTDGDGLGNTYLPVYHYDYLPLTPAGWTPAQYYETVPWDFEAHTNAHESLTTKSELEIRSTLETCNALFLQNNLPYPEHFAYPGGNYNTTIETIVADYYQTAATTVGGSNGYPISNPYELKRTAISQFSAYLYTTLNSSIENKRLMIVMVHEISSYRSDSAGYDALNSFCSVLYQHQLNGNLTVMNMKDAWEAYDGSECVVVITFDDIWVTDYLAQKVLSKYGFSGTSYTVTGNMDRFSFLSWDSAREMSNLMFVDDDAGASWYSQTRVKTIQEGYNNATSGDTIYVFNGSYTEKVKIDNNYKPVSIIGNSSTSTILSASDSGSDAITITINNCNVSKLKVRDARYGINLSNANNTALTDITTTNTTKGIYIQLSNNVSAGTLYNIIETYVTTNNVTYSSSVDLSSYLITVNSTTLSLVGTGGATNFTFIVKGNASMTLSYLSPYKIAFSSISTPNWLNISVTGIKSGYAHPLYVDGTNNSYLGNNSYATFNVSNTATEFIIYSSTTVELDVTAAPTNQLSVFMDYFNMVLPILLIAAMIPIIIIILGNFKEKNLEKNTIDTFKNNKKQKYSFGKRGRGGLFD